MALALPATAAEQTSVSVTNSNASQNVTGQSEVKPTQELATVDESTRAVGRLWGLNDEEMLRAQLLMKGPRGNFSVQNISPVEVLGIHARSAAERRKYAELFAKAFHDDVERSLIWNQLFVEVYRQRYGTEPAIVNSPASVPLGVNPAAAGALGIPRTSLQKDVE